MPTYLLSLQYDGTKYKGFQRLGHTEYTIQGKIENVLSKFLGFPMEVHGSGRTDQGVHAAMQKVSFTTEKPIDTKELLSVFYQYLPKDIIVHDITKKPYRFHARLSATKKEYTYTIDRGFFPDVFQRHYALHEKAHLDLKAMKEAAKILIGLHDFSAFTSAKSKTKSMVREIYHIDFVEEGPFLKMVFTGNGFLQGMVRIITATLLAIGKHEMAVEKVSSMLEDKKRLQEIGIAPPHGLSLTGVFYDGLD